VSSNVTFTSGEPGGTRMDLILAIKEIAYALETGLDDGDTDRQYLAEQTLKDLRYVEDQTVAFGR
jgi:hypothetical protein